MDPANRILIWDRAHPCGSIPMSMEILAVMFEEKGKVHIIFLFIVDLGFASEAALENHVSIHQNVFGAIVFASSSDWVSLPRKISYKVRLRSDKGSSMFPQRRNVEWRTDAMFPGFNATGQREAEDPFGGKKPGIFICR